MKNIMEKASAGNRQAMIELYEKYRKGAKAVCSSCMGDVDAANEAVVHAFRNTWSYLLNHSIKSEEEFQTVLYKQAAILCRRNYVKNGMKALQVPRNRNFLAAKWQEECREDITAMDNLLRMMPDLNRYLLVLHRIAGFDEKMIGSITGYKKETVEAAISAEARNLEMALEHIRKKTKKSVNLEKEILKYKEKAHLPEQYCQQILSEIDQIVKPYEKKHRMQIGLYGICTAGIIFLVCMFVASYNKEEPEIVFSTGKASQENSTSEESGMTLSNEQTGTEEESGMALSDGETYFADIEIEDYGIVTIELDYETAPVTVENFISLAETDFYDGLTFHRIMEGFMMQGGDPNGDGTGGAEENIVGEFSDNGYENNLSHVRGVVSMARSSAYDSASSQFFIVQEDSTFLDGQYAAFGWVIEGMDIVDAICTEAAPTDDNGTIQAEEQPVISSITIRVENGENEVSE